jgi:opacity protein-like surface antigen
MMLHAKIMRRLLLATAVLIAVAPASASADAWIVPFAGVNFAGDSGKALSNAVDASRLHWGASFGAMGAGVFGAEGDFGYSPDFYGKNDVGGSNVFTATGNLVVGVPFGGQQGFGVRPYGLFGLGLIRSSVETVGDLAKVQADDFGWNFGGGVMIFFSNHVGLRGDLRYFRTFGATDLGELDITAQDDATHFARGSAGLILRF